MVDEGLTATIPAQEWKAAAGVSPDADPADELRP